MDNIRFRAMITEEYEPNKFSRKIGEKEISQLPDNDVLIKVSYSSLNYKDALSARGHKGITRRYPHTPGIDAAGEVVEDRTGKFKPGARVVVTGRDLGMNTSGGFAEFIRVPADWPVPLPPTISLLDSMIYGTAGFTAGICMYELRRNGVNPGEDVLVTGATGGVGSLAVGMLAKAGYRALASTGKDGAREYLEKLGAVDVLSREDVRDESGRPLLGGRWMGAIDTVGGVTLSTVIRSTKHRGVVCCLGNVEDDKFETSVYPFILRGVTLTGIDSAERPMDVRLHVWDRIASDWLIDRRMDIVRIVSLEDLDPEIELILRGGQTGRVVVDLNR
ncbi:MAG: YhdH/YhfP family quinone oxidoreductase [Candidatus Kapaibacterium sp.]